MNKIWVELFLGKIGKYIIDFFSRYYLWFTPFIFAYGIFMTLASYNLRRMEKKVDYEVINQAKYLLKKNPEINFINLVEDIFIDWEERIRLYSFFPFLANDFDLWVIKTSPDAAKYLILEDENRIRLILERHNIFFQKENRYKSENLYVNHTRRIFKKKI